MAGLDDYQYYAKFQSAESPFWESPNRQRPSERRPVDTLDSEDSIRMTRYDENERFAFFDEPGLEDDEPQESSSHGLSFPGSVPDIKSGKDAWESLFGPRKKKNTAAERESEACVTKATKNYSLCLNAATSTAEYLIAHPFLVIRRQCQVNSESVRFHLSPLSTIGVVYRLAKAQGIFALSKGFTSVLLVKGISVWTEDCLNRVTPWSSTFPKSFSLVDTVGHLSLKCGGLVAAAPFQAASLVETVQSDIASELPGFLDVLIEGAYRLTCWNFPQSGRLLPIWAVVPASVVEGVARYSLTELLFRMLSFGDELLHPKKYFQEKRWDSQGVEVEPSVAERISWATKDLHNTSVFRLWAAFLAHVLTYPLETVLNRLLLQGTRTIIDDLDSNGTSVIAVLSGYSGFRDCVRTMMVEEGFRGFYKGVGTLFWTYLAQFALLRVADLVLVQYFSYSSPADDILSRTQSSPVSPALPSDEWNRMPPRADSR
ncbi:unnamed protein product [Notodromas monacha]|uniref:Solute carrier family 25 member 46 n=1 Tax=Notodromas monacha TaxID=399045 RepID=A0A7R9GB15_9CRUS|nr:unnamed protein product [Notodromas monacha]CAG0915841.1 unnamed protein product [Notodromas monacha]